MCAEALADIVVFNQTFLQAKKCKKKKNLNYAVCVSRLSADYCSFLSNFFACKKYKNKKNLNYAVCVSRLSAGRGDRTRTCGILVPNQAPYQLGDTSLNVL